MNVFSISFKNIKIVHSLQKREEKERPVAPWARLVTVPVSE